MSLLESEPTHLRQQKSNRFLANINPLQGGAPYFPKLIYHSSFTFGFMVDVSIMPMKSHIEIVILGMVYYS